MIGATLSSRVKRGICFFLLAGGVAFAADQLGAVTFTDVTAAAGIKFTHNAGKSGKKYLPETLGAGGAFFEADGDGWLDIFLVNGKDWTPRGRRCPLGSPFGLPPFQTTPGMRASSSGPPLFAIGTILATGRR